MSVQAPKLVKECIERYDPTKKRIMMPENSIVISLSREVMQSAFGVPIREEFYDINFESSTWNVQWKEGSQKDIHVKLMVLDS